MIGEWMNLDCESEFINCLCEYDVSESNNQISGLYAHHYKGLYLTSFLDDYYQFTT